MTYLLLRYLHLAAVLGLVGAVVIENIAIKPVITQEDARNLAKVDRVAGLAAIVALIAGITLWLWVGKPADFYSTNPVFHAKLGFFGLLICTAIYPALFFIKHRLTSSEEIVVPNIILILLKLELGLLLVIPLLAFLMARGIGLN